MGLVALVEVEDRAADVLGRLEPGLQAVRCEGTSFVLEMRGRTPELEVVVIGATVADPIQTAQRACRLDPGVTVVLLGLGQPAQRARVMEALRFAPWVGSDVVYEDLVFDELPRWVSAAAERTRARRKHRAVLRTLNAQIASAQSTPRSPREELAAHLLDRIPIGVLSLDSEGKVMSVNPEASRLLSVSERELLGRGPDAPEAAERPWAKLVASARTHETTAIVEQARGSETLSLEALATPLVGPLGGFLLVIKDVTDRERLRLERRVAREGAEVASRLKDEFLVMVSHELRTPLQAIIGWTRLAQRGRLSPEKLTQALDTIDRNASAQKKLVEDLLDIDHLIAGKMRLAMESVDLRAVVREAVEIIESAATAKEIQLSWEVEPDVPILRGDPARLHQVVWHLLSNAVKFTPAGGNVRLAARAVGSGIELRVSDNGPGVPEEALPFIFDAFRQADGGTKRVHGGLGLGLAIARRIVELHGGTLEARNDPEAGITFSVRLPLLRGQSSFPPPPTN